MIGRTYQWLLLELLHFDTKRNPDVLNGVASSDYFNVSNGVRQGGVLSPKLFAICIDDLSSELALCKSVCYINEQCMNHVIYEGVICLLAPSVIGLQQMLDVCFNLVQEMTLYLIL